MSHQNLALNMLTAALVLTSCAGTAAIDPSARPGVGVTTSPPTTAAPPSGSMDAPVTSPLGSSLVTLTITGDEYETAQGTSLNGSNGVLCPPTGPAPTLPTPCWVWSAPRLGQGTYTQVFSPGTPADVAAQIVRWTFVLRTDDDDTIAGDGTAHLDFAPGEQNVVGLNHRFVCTVHLTVGTGRLVGVAGTLTGDLVSTVVDIDPSTNISHKSVTASFTGPITTG